MIALVAMSGLMINRAEATPVALVSGTNNITTLANYESLWKDSATINGYSGDVANGTYQGAALAYTSTTATGGSIDTGFYDSEWAATKVTWDTSLQSSSPSLVDLYLNLDASVATDDWCILAASCSATHGIDVTFEIWGQEDFAGLPSIYGLIGYDYERLNSGGDINKTVLLARNVDGPFDLHVVFDDASYSDIWLGGVSTSSALGSLGFTLSADAVPEPSSMLLLGLGLVVLGCIGKWKFNRPTAIIQDALLLHPKGSAQL